MTHPRQDGFTLVELIIVIAIMGILAAITVPQFRPAPQRAREAVLKTDLHTMREAIDQYFADKARYPESLETLVDEGYLREVPKDPFTLSTSTWRLIYAEESDDPLPEEEAATSPGIFDVKSGVTEKSLNGEDMSEW
jgi:general secretion pathway protein G